MLKTTEQSTEYNGFFPKVGGAYSIDPPPRSDLALKIEAQYSNPPVRKTYSKLLSDSVWVKDKWKNCQHHSVKFGGGTVPYPTLGFPFVLRNLTDLGTYSGSLAPWELAYAGLPYSVFGPLGNHLTGFSTLLQDEEDGDGFVPRPPSLQPYINASLKAMMPGIKAQLSLVNSLYELKDFKTLPHTLLHLKNYVSNLVSVVKRKPKFLGHSIAGVRRNFPASMPTMAESLGVSADSYLQTKFNILPLLDDIAGIYRSIMRTKSRVNDLLVRQGKRQIRHFKLLVPSFQAAETSGTLQYNLHGGQFDGSVGSTDTKIGAYASPACAFRCVRELIPDQYAEFHAQVEYNYWFTRFQTENAQWLGLLDALGVNLNPAIIWNAIPWTFVVDWVVDVSRWLGERKVLNLGPAVNISRYMWSWKYSRTVRLRMSANSIVSPDFSDYVYLPDLVETIYRRDLEMPTQSQFLTGTGLSSQELSLGVALLITTGKHPKRRRT
jgi:hypothetical protein